MRRDGRAGEDARGEEERSGEGGGKGNGGRGRGRVVGARRGEGRGEGREWGGMNKQQSSQSTRQPASNLAIRKNSLE